MCNVGLLDVRMHVSPQELLHANQCCDMCRLYRPRPHLTWSSLWLTQRQAKLVLSRGYGKPLLTTQSWGMSLLKLSAEVLHSIDGSACVARLIMALSVWRRCSWWFYEWRLCMCGWTMLLLNHSGHITGQNGVHSVGRSKNFFGILNWVNEWLWVGPIIIHVKISFVRVVFVMVYHVMHEPHDNSGHDGVDMIGWLWHGRSVWQLHSD